MKEKEDVTLNKERFLSPEFKELWDKIKYKTVYQVDFSSEELIEKCLVEIEKTLTKTQRRISQLNALVGIKQGGIVAKETESGRIYSLNKVELAKLPDVVTNLQNATDLTRKTIIEILIRSNTLDVFELNPQIYMQEMTDIINSVKEDFIVDGIKYSKHKNKDYYAQQLFEDEEISGYMNDNLLKSEKGVYDHVVYDSTVEREFAEKLESNRDVLVYVKLPRWFKIPTPLGNYNPDWAILINDDGKEKFYFVTETKGVRRGNRTTEEKKIDCGIEHFKAVGEDVKYIVATTFDDVLNEVNS